MNSGVLALPRALSATTDMEEACWLGDAADCCTETAGIEEGLSVDDAGEAEMRCSTAAEPSEGVWKAKLLDARRITSTTETQDRVCLLRNKFARLILNVV